MIRRAIPLLTVLAILLVAGSPFAPAQDGFEAPPPDDPEAKKLYLKAVEMQRRGKWQAAKRAFEKLIEEHPTCSFAADAENRSGDNAYLGTTKLWESGPSARRIDVSVMGDGFTIDPGDQQKQEKWAKLCLEVLWNEDAFDEYRNYFNFYFVRLASLEEGVDPNLSPEEKEKIEERNRRRVRKRKTEYNTALDCKAAGPQGQVMADRGLVYKWLDIANADVAGCGDDRLVIAFAQFGKLGMGGGGIANVGRPDKSITTHEFGHAFSRLLDEYAVNPMRPEGGMIPRAANASPTDDPRAVPWAHMLEKRVKGVGIYEGGATFQKGVWRPAASCAMNTNATKFCPVCREATILVIYEHVSPIDTVAPAPSTEIKVEKGDDVEILVTPMQPARRALEATWWVETIAADVPGPEPEETSGSDGSSAREGWWRSRFRGGGRGGAPQLPYSTGGRRGRTDREGYDAPPAGEESKLGREVRGRGSDPTRLAFPVGKLAPGRYKITVEVRDPTPWVIKDDQHLLAERETWWVSVNE